MDRHEFLRRLDMGLMDVREVGTPAGDVGAQGTQGEPGLVGPQGPQGDQGDPGPAGADGNDGAQGPPGEIGPTGPQGPPGADGAQGIQGPPGAAGVDGAAGAQGVTGPEGPAGVDGADGAAGAQGPEGPQGPQGIQGVQGPQGDPGEGGGFEFPVGWVLMSFVDVNPATFLGYGTWAKALAGRVFVGQDAGQTEFDTLKETGGAKTHTLTTAEMPAHSHQILRERSATTGAATTQIARTADTSSTVDTNISTAEAGSGGAHNNLQPFGVGIFWERTA